MRNAEERVTDRLVSKRNVVFVVFIRIKLLGDEFYVLSARRLILGSFNSNLWSCEDSHLNFKRTVGILEKLLLFRPRPKDKSRFSSVRITDSRQGNISAQKGKELKPKSFSSLFCNRRILMIPDFLCR